MSPLLWGLGVDDLLRPKGTELETRVRYHLHCILEVWRKQHKGRTTSQSHKNISDCVYQKKKPSTGEETETLGTGNSTKRQG